MQSALRPAVQNECRSKQSMLKSYPILPYITHFTLSLPYLSFDAYLRAAFSEKIMGDFRKMLQRIDNGEMDPCRDFLSICKKVNPLLGFLCCCL